MRKGIATAAVLAALALVSVTGCGGGADDPSAGRPAGVRPSYDELLMAFPQQATTHCVQGPAGDAAACAEWVRKTLDTLHELRDTIKARPDADRYPKTLAAIDKVDKVAEDLTGNGCWGSLAGPCLGLARQIAVNNNVLQTLETEDAPRARR